MRRLAVTFLLLAASALAAPRPRVVLHPVATPPDVGFKAPAAATAALLAEAATHPLQLPSTFEVDDALVSLQQPDCAERDACLGALAKVTKAGWAVAVVARLEDGAWRLTGRVVDDAGRPVRLPRTVDVPAAMVGFEWAVAASALLSALDVDRLGGDDERHPLLPAAAPVAVAAPPAPALAAPALAPRLEAAAPPPSRGAPLLAAVAGGLAVAGGGAAVALALVNAREAELLRASAQGGLIPAGQVERAVALDERTTAAVGLGVGAAVGAGVAVALGLWPAGAPARPSLVVSPQGSAVVVSGALP